VKTTLSSVCTQDPLFLILLTMRILPILILTRSTTVLCHAFQLGSEAMVPPWPVVLPRGFDAAGSVIPVTERVIGAEQRTTPTNGDQEAGKLNGLPSSSVAGRPKSIPPLARYWKLNVLGLLLLLGSMCSPLWMMMPRIGGGGGGGGGDFTYRIPPAWAPENEQHYSFRARCQDIPLWLMLTDLQPAQQAAAIVMRLGGAARELVRSITSDEIVNGGQINGVQIDPIAYLVAGLQQRCAMLDDEHRLAAMTLLLACARRQGETINGTLCTI
jgi:hypothetical protein